MPNGAVHVAFAALALTAIGFKGKQRAWLALVAILPDLDVVTAIPWLFLSSHLPLSAGVLEQGTYLLGHRGFSHTLSAAGLAGMVTWWWRRDAWETLGVTTVWASHVALDAVTPWPTQPLWPFSEVSVQRPLITTLDPLVSVPSLLVLLALLATVLAHKLPWPGHARRERLGEQGAFYTEPLLAVSLAAGLITVAGIPLTAVAQDVPMHEVRPAGFPATYTARLDGLTWEIEEHASPWSPGVPTEVPVFDPSDEQGRPLGGAPSARMGHAWCVLERLDAYAPVAHPALRYDGSSRPPRQVHVIDALRNTTDEGGPVLTFAFDGADLTDVYIGGGPGDGQGDGEARGPGPGGFQLSLPQALWEGAPCR
ncbi:MAG: metal-dependent hydrolase [Candidatus Thermoplasmatota archaeon]|nr:metal-dependent hydrolase [Candidatus Thermoplasmatota archaeon]